MITKQKFLIVIGGATAVGKSALAIHLAQHYNTAIISADSRQIYKELTIGTAKPNETELQLVHHYFINHISVQQHYSVSDFDGEVVQCLHQLFLQKDVVIMVGGTGLYINAVLYGLDEIPEVNPSINSFVQQIFDTNGIEGLQVALKDLDETYYQNADLQNPHRLMRAIAVSMSSGKPFSSFLKHKKQARSFIPICINLVLDRGLLYEKINHRVDIMIKNGLLNEVKNLLQYKDTKALQTVGYQEIFDYFDGKNNLEFAIDKIKQHSRNYAKRQITWFKKNVDWQDFDASVPYEIIRSYLEERFAQTRLYSD